MLYFKRLIVAQMYAEGDKESIEKKKQNIEYMLKEAFFFLVNGRYEFIHTLSCTFVVFAGSGQIFIIYCLCPETNQNFFNTAFFNVL